MKALAILVPVALITPLLGQTNIVSDPLGFNSLTCYPASDTVLGVPFRQNGSQQGTLSAIPTEFPDPLDPTQTLATLSLSGSPGFDPIGGPDNGGNGEFANTHYVKFSSGSLDGKIFPITANTTDQLTIALNGDSVTSAVVDDSLIIGKYWTLNELFPPNPPEGTGPTTTWTETPPGSGNWVPDGHAIVASTNFLSSGRMTEVMLPRLDLAGINIAPIDKFYIWDNAWRKAGESPSSTFGTTPLHPDVYIVIRHDTDVSHPTTFKCSGEVELGIMAVPLSTNSTASGIGPQDNFIALPRPVDVTLNDLDLIPGAFEASTNFLSSGRTDELLVFDNSESYTAFNKAPSIKYFYWDGTWRKQSDGYPFPDAGLEKIPAGAGFMIRKTPTTDGATIFWNNTAAYSNQP